MWLVLVGRTLWLTLLLFGGLGWTGFGVWYASAATWGQGDGGNDLSGGGGCVSEGWGGRITIWRVDYVCVRGRR